MAEAQSAWFCSDVSSAAGEPLAGTAPLTSVWILLEYGGPWERKALESSAVPQPVKDQLKAAEKAIPAARVQLIKQGGSGDSAGLTLFVARSGVEASALYRFSPARYEDILSLDLPKIAAGDPRYDENIVDDPLFIVCTNGRRDQCCARDGLPIFQRMSGQMPEAVWQTTHLGGHRLGPNVVLLPQGIFYGRVKPADVDALLDIDHISLNNLRGRACLPPPAQAAETFARRQEGGAATSGLSGVEITETGDKKWTVQLALDGQPHSLDIEQVPAGYATYASCGDDHPTDVMEFRLANPAGQPS